MIANSGELPEKILPPLAKAATKNEHSATLIVCHIPALMNRPDVLLHHWGVIHIGEGNLRYWNAKELQSLPDYKYVLDQILNSITNKFWVKSQTFG